MYANSSVFGGGQASGGVTAPANGVVTAWRLRTGSGGDSASLSLQVLRGNLAIATSDSISTPASPDLTPHKLGKASAAAVAGKSTKLKLKISKKTARVVKRAPKKKKKVQAKVTVTTVDAAGNQSSANRTIRAKR